MKLFVPIQKVDAAKRLVYGRATDETPDLSGEIFDYATSAPNFKAWSGELEKLTGGKSKGNVRAMHGKVAAGKLTEIGFDDVAKAIDVCAHIVDDAEWKKVEEGVYTGFSIGGSYAKRWADETNPTLKRYTAVPSEISIVDLACNPNSGFEMIKADGMIEKVAFAKAAEVEEPAPVVELEQVWKAKDGSTYKLKADALAKNVEIDAAAVIVAPVVVAPVIEPAPVLVIDAEKAAPNVLAKSMYDVKEFASILSNLRWLVMDLEGEAKYEGDGSTVPAELKNWLVAGVKIFISLATEEAKELVGDVEIDFDGVIALAAKTEGLSKAADNSAQSIHDHSTKIGAKCAKVGNAADGDLAKMTADLATSTDDLAKMATERDDLRNEVLSILKFVPANFGTEGKPVSEAVEKMAARLDALEKQAKPGGPKTVFAVTKTADVAVAELGEGELDPTALAKMSPEQRGIALMKAAQSRPITL